jgi:hypothetical protein
MCVRAWCVATESLQLSHVCTILYLHSVWQLPFWGVFIGGLVLFAGFAAGLLAGVSAQFIHCGEYRSAVKVSTCNNPPLKKEKNYVINTYTEPAQDVPVMTLEARRWSSLS